MKRIILLFIGLLLPIRATAAREVPSVAWKVLLYFAAGNNLRPEYEAQLDELRCLCLGKDVEVLILFDRGNPPAGAPCSPPCAACYGATLYRVSSCGLEALSTFPTWNTGSGEALEAFVAEADRRIRSDRTALFLIDHGRGWYGTMRDGADALTAPKIRAALLPRADAGAPLDLLVFASCDMGALEVMAHLPGCASYAVAGEDILWTSNWDFPAILRTLSCHGAVDGRALAGICLDTCPCVNDPDDVFSPDNGYGHRQLLSVLCVIDVAAIPALTSKVSSLAGALTSSIRADPASALALRIARDHCMDFLCSCFGEHEGVECCLRGDCQVDLMQLVHALRKFAPSLAGPEAKAVEDALPAVIVRSTPNPLFEDACGLGVHFPCQGGECAQAVSGRYRPVVPKELDAWLEMLTVYLATETKPPALPLHLRTSIAGGALRSPMIRSPEVLVDGADPSVIARSGMALEFQSQGSTLSLGWSPLGMRPTQAASVSLQWPMLRSGEQRSLLSIERLTPLGPRGRGWLLESRLRLASQSGVGLGDVVLGMRLEDDGAELLFVARGGPGGGRIPARIEDGQILVPYAMVRRTANRWIETMRVAPLATPVPPGVSVPLRVRSGLPMRVELAPPPVLPLRIVFGATTGHGDPTYVTSEVPR